VIFQGPSNFSLYSHGVNNAVALKWAAAWSHVYGPPELAEARQLTGEGWEKWGLHQQKMEISLVNSEFAMEKAPFLIGKYR
jgi:hypothetical protein